MRTWMPKVSAGGTAILCLVLLCLPAHAAGNEKFEELKWEALVPKGWDPSKDFKDLDFSKLKDGDPRASEALQSLKSAWDAAPAEPSLNGKKVRIAGFILPLDQTGEAVKTALLVPYFGACIHTPPPPANQIIQINLVKPQPLRTMDAVWVSGTIDVFRSDSPWGAAGYRISAVKVEAYK